MLEETFGFIFIYESIMMELFCKDNAGLTVIEI